MTVVLAKRSDKPRARPRGRPHPTDNGDAADAGRSSMAPRQVPVPLRAARQGTQHSGTKLLSQPRDLIESRSKWSCQPLSLYKKCPCLITYRLLPFAVAAVRADISERRLD